MVIGGLALAVLFAFLFGWIVMLLWNRLMPQIFGLPQISYWQGWGLVLLSHILVKGGWGSGCSGDKGKRRSGHGGRDDECDTSDDWCDDCSKCDDTETCRPYAHGWIRTADGWKREGSAMKSDGTDSPSADDSAKN
jgi:hypothetical protein